jgi:hypothetical protein
MELTSSRRCRSLVAYGNVTLIGSESSYYVEQTEQVAGRVMMREAEPDWEY